MGKRKVCITLLKLSVSLRHTPENQCYEFLGSQNTGVIAVFCFFLGGGSRAEWCWGSRS